MVKALQGIVAVCLVFVQLVEAPAFSAPPAFGRTGFLSQPPQPLLLSEALAPRALSPRLARFYVDIQTFEGRRKGLQPSNFQIPSYAVPSDQPGDPKTEYLDV